MTGGVTRDEMVTEDWQVIGQIDYPVNHLDKTRLELRVAGTEPG